ncbi:hypothetical protein HY572_01110 [Candidatus Micrarchaeota archaeon]|nr:hypothetical protein [Candidatus Micrarchaeota archaeon]
MNLTNGLPRFALLLFVVLLLVSMTSAAKLDVTVIEKEDLRTDTFDSGKLVIVKFPSGYVDYRQYVAEHVKFLKEIGLRNSFAPVRIFSVPKGASVTIWGNDLGNTPTGALVSLNRPQSWFDSLRPGGYDQYLPIEVEVQKKGRVDSKTGKRISKHTFTTDDILKYLDGRLGNPDGRNELQWAFDLKKEVRETSQLPLTPKSFASGGSITTSTAKPLELSSVPLARSTAGSLELDFAVTPTSSFKVLDLVRGVDDKLYAAYLHVIDDVETIDGEVNPRQYESFGIAVQEEDQKTWHSLGEVEEVVRHLVFPKTKPGTYKFIQGTDEDGNSIIQERCTTSATSYSGGNFYYALVPSQKGGVTAYYGRSRTAHTIGSDGVASRTRDDSGKPTGEIQCLNPKVTTDSYSYEFNDVKSVHASAQDGWGSPKTEARGDFGLDFLGTIGESAYFKRSSGDRSCITPMGFGTPICKTEEDAKNQVFSVPSPVENGKFEERPYPVENPFGQNLFLRLPQYTLSNTYEKVVRKDTVLTQLQGGQFVDKVRFGNGKFFGFDVKTFFDGDGDLHMAMQGPQGFYYQFEPKSTFQENAYPTYQKVYVFHPPGKACPTCEFLSQSNVPFEENPKTVTQKVADAVRDELSLILDDQGIALVYIDKAGKNHDKTFRGEYPDRVGLAKVLGLRLDPIKVRETSGAPIWDAPRIFAVYADDEGAPVVAIKEPEYAKKITQYAFDDEAAHRGLAWTESTELAYQGSNPTLRGWPAPADQGDLELITSMSYTPFTYQIPGANRPSYGSVTEYAVHTTRGESRPVGKPRFGIPGQVSKISANGKTVLPFPGKATAQLTSRPSMTHHVDACPSELEAGHLCVVNGLIKAHVAKNSQLTVSVSGTTGQIAQFALSPETRVDEGGSIYVRLTDVSDPTGGQPVGTLTELPAVNLILVGDKEGKLMLADESYREGVDGDLTLLSNALLADVDLARTIDGKTYEQLQSEIPGLSRTAFLIMKKKSTFNGALSIREWVFMAKELQSNRGFSFLDVSRIMLWKLVYEKVNEPTSFDALFNQKPGFSEDQMAAVYAYMPRILSDSRKDAVADLAPFYARIVAGDLSSRSPGEFGAGLVREQWIKLGYGFKKDETPFYADEALAAYVMVRKKAVVMSWPAWHIEMDSPRRYESLAGVYSGAHVYQRLNDYPGALYYSVLDEYLESMDFEAANTRAEIGGGRRISSLVGPSDQFAMHSIDSRTVGLT